LSNTARCTYLTSRTYPGHSHERLSGLKDLVSLKDLVKSAHDRLAAPATSATPTRTHGRLAAAAAAAPSPPTTQDGLGPADATPTTTPTTTRHDRLAAAVAPAQPAMARPGSGGPEGPAAGGTSRALGVHKVRDKVRQADLACPGDARSRDRERDPERDLEIKSGGGEHTRTVSWLQEEEEEGRDVKGQRALGDERARLEGADVRGQTL